MTAITIVGTGAHVPGDPISNEALARVMDTSDEWIIRRTGIEQRHFAEDGQGASDLGVPAAKKAIAAAGLEPSDIDYIIFATMTPDHFFPGCGPILGAKLGIPGVPALDIRQQCAAIPYALQLANGLAASGAAKNILLVGAEAHAGFMPWSSWDVVRSQSDREVSKEEFERATRHRGLAIIFGDGASAMVLQKSDQTGAGFIDAQLHSDGNQCETLFTPGVGFRQVPYVTPEALAEEQHIPRMRGQSLFKTAVHQLTRVVRNLLDENDLTKDDVDWFIAHQANDRINEAVRRALKVPKEKVPSNIARYGNTSAATIGLLTDELLREGTMNKGDLVCFFALGAGLNWGAALLRL